MKVKFDNQTKNYPIVLIPSGIHNNLIHGIKITKEEIAKHINPPYKEYSKYIHTVPKKPKRIFYKTKETEKFIWSGLRSNIFLTLTFSLLPTYFSFLIFSDNFLKTYIIISSLVFIVVNIAFRDNLFEKKEIQFKINLTEDELNEKQKKYEEMQKEWAREKAKLIKKWEIDESKYETKKSELIKKLALSKQFEAFKPFEVAKRNLMQSKIGASELKFLKLIKKNILLGNYIYMDMRPEGTQFNPDLTLINDKNNLHFDIEIDEPYQMSDKTPIHFLGDNDEKRNALFLDLNWCVIRFTERQICLSPNECISTIISIHDSILKNEKEYNCFVNIEKKWSYEDAKIMASEKYREKYLLK